MQRTESQEMRTFAQGMLQFDAQNGTFTDIDHTQHTLTRVEPAAISPTLHQHIYDYLHNQPQA